MDGHGRTKRNNSPLLSTRPLLDRGRRGRLARVYICNAELACRPASGTRSKNVSLCGCLRLASTPRIRPCESPPRHSSSRRSAP
eukprot:2342774-Pyramimonas_sp.AAC.1